jgi:hypothetical protein
MSNTQNTKPQNAFIAARFGNGQPTPPLPPPDIPRESLRALIQMPLNLTGGVKCPTSSNTKTKTE